MERNYSAIEEMYAKNLGASGDMLEAPSPPESDTQVANYEQAPAPAQQTEQASIGNTVDLDYQYATFNKLTFNLLPEDVTAIERILANRVISNLQKLANEWDTKYNK